MNAQVDNVAALAWLRAVDDHRVRQLCIELCCAAEQRLWQGCVAAADATTADQTCHRLVFTGLGCLVWHMQKATPNEALFSYFRGDTKQDDLTVGIRLLCWLQY